VHRHVRKILARLLDGVDYSTLIDVGCGAGHNLPLLCEGRRMEKVSGVDVSTEALERARAIWPGGEFAELDVQTEHLDGKWDMVSCCFVLEHVPDDEGALRNMAAMSRRWVLATSIAGDFDRYRAWDEQVGHVRNYRVGEMEQKMRAAGITPQKVVYWGFPFYSPLARLLQNRMKAESEYSATTKLIAKVMYAIYFLNSSRRGDVVFALGTV
jgi:trans-aconitate methyltransferase